MHRRLDSAASRQLLGDSLPQAARSDDLKGHEDQLDQAVLHGLLALPLNQHSAFEFAAETQLPWERQDHRLRDSIVPQLLLLPVHALLVRSQVLRDDVHWQFRVLLLLDDLSLRQYDAHQLRLRLLLVVPDSPRPVQVHAQTGGDSEEFAAVWSHISS